MAFAPHARLDDGLLDICAVRCMTRLQLIGCMKEAEDLGAAFVHPSAAARAHVDYAQVRGPGGRERLSIAARARARMVCVQVREVVVRPPDEAAQAAWLAGGGREAAGAAVSPSAAVAERADAASGGGAVPSEGAASLVRARRLLNVHPKPMVGRPMNVDGEISGWFPCRLTVVPRVLTVYVPPPQPATV